MEGKEAEQKSMNNKQPLYSNYLLVYEKYYYVILLLLLLLLLATSGRG